MKYARLLILAMGLASPGAWSAPPADPAPRVSYVALNVFDEKRALDFYVGVLGMSERRRILPAAGIKEILLAFTQNPDDTGVLLMVSASREKPYEVGDGFSRVIVDVADLNVTVKRLTDAGVTLVRPVTETKDLHLRYAMAKDPDGYLIEFVQHLKSAS
jgi:lactoylglutathione lyase